MSTKGIIRYIILVLTLAVIVVTVKIVRYANEENRNNACKSYIKEWAGEDVYNIYSLEGSDLFIHCDKSVDILPLSPTYINECLKSAEQAINQLGYEQQSRYIIINATIDDFQVVIGDSLYTILFGINGEFDKAIFISPIEETDVPYNQINTYINM